MYFIKMAFVSSKEMLAFGLSCFALGALAGFRQAKDNVTVPVAPAPQIGISFDSPPYAEQLRKSGDLDRHAADCAALGAVDNYFQFGLTGAQGAVTVILPRREDLAEIRKMPPDNTTSCEP